MVKAWMLLPATSPSPARPRTPSVSVRRLGRQESTLQCMQATIQWRWASDERGARVERVVGAAAPEATSSPQPHGDECTRHWGVAWFWQVRAVLEEGRLDQQQGVQEECVQGRASAAGRPGCIAVAVLKSFSTLSTTTSTNLSLSCNVGSSPPRATC